MKKYQNPSHLKTYTLGVADIRDLIIRVKADFEKPRGENFYTYLDNVNINEDSLEKFLSHTEVPDILRNFHWNIGDTDFDKNIELDFYDTFTDLKVRGTNETWVRGMSSKIEQLLQIHRNRFSFLRSGFFYMIQGAAYPIGAVLIVIEIAGFLHNEIKYGIFLSAGFLLVLFITSIRGPRNKIYTRSGNSRMDFATKINLALTAIIAIGTLVLIFR